MVALLSFGTGDFGDAGFRFGWQICAAWVWMCTLWRYVVGLSSEVVCAVVIVNKDVVFLVDNLSPDNVVILLAFCRVLCGLHPVDMDPRLCQKRRDRFAALVLEDNKPSY